LMSADLVVKYEVRTRARGRVEWAVR